MTSNGQDQRPMSVRSFAEAMKVNQSQESLIGTSNDGSTQMGQSSAPPMPKIPSIYNDITSDDRHTPGQPLSSPSSTSSFSLELPIHAPPTPPGETPRLRQGLPQQATYMPSPDVFSMKGALAGTEKSTPHQAKPTIKRKPVPQREDHGLGAGSKAARQLYHYDPPPTPTRPNFPGDVFEPRHMTTSEQSEPTTRPPTSKDGKATTKDPFHREVHDAFAHVYKPKPKPQPKPKLRRNESSRAFETASNFFKGLKKTAKGFGAHRDRANKRKSGVGISLPIHGSLHDFHPNTHGQDNVLHAGLKAVPVREAQKDLAGRSGLASADPEPVKPRKVKVIGHPDRGTVFGDFLDPKIFDSSSEESVEVDQPRLSSRRNRGLSKPLPPLPSQASSATAHQTTRPHTRPSCMPGSLRGEIPDRNSSRMPSPHDSVISKAAVVEPPLAAIPPRWEIPARHPRPDKRVDTSKHDWVPDKDCQKGEKYDSIRSGVDYPEVDDSDSEEPEQILATDRQIPQRPASRPPGLDFSPTTPVDWDAIHNGVFPSGLPVFDPKYHANVEMPRFDTESPTTDELFAGVTDEELSRARRQEYLEAARKKNRTKQQLKNDHSQKEAAVGRLFDGIDKLVDTNTDVPESSKPWFNGELHRMNDKLHRERRESDGSIIIDMFPHDAHTSWRATERTDDYTIHSGYQRFTREGYEHGDGQDSAGLLMEKLSRQMRGE